MLDHDMTSVIINRLCIIFYSDVTPAVFHNFQITEGYLANSLKSKLQTNVIGVISNTQLQYSP